MKMITLNFGQRSVVLTGTEDELVRKVVAAVKVARLRGESIPEEVDCSIDEIADLIDALPSNDNSAEEASLYEEDDAAFDEGFAVTAAASVKKNSSGGAAAQ